MARNQKLEALPSKVILPNKNLTELDTLSAEIKAEIRQKMCQNISRQLSVYYSAHPKEWAVFLKVMTVSD